LRSSRKKVASRRPAAYCVLELEITESLIMEDVEHSIAILEAIRAMGVSIAIDDFDTGFSSLSYLSKLPVDTLKIDCSFVNDMTADPAGLALVSAIINLAHSLKLKVVAERSIAYLPYCSTAARDAQLCGRRLVKTCSRY
jgi:EAL domain-containing protein (putative c-di-GMP-specific phosphodiesterase class I)